MVKQVFKWWAASLAWTTSYWAHQQLLFNHNKLACKHTLDPYIIRRSPCVPPEFQPDLRLWREPWNRSPSGDVIDFLQTCARQRSRRSQMTSSKVYTDHINRGHRVFSLSTNAQLVNVANRPFWNGYEELLSVWHWEGSQLWHLASKPMG